jgi:DNA-directed RNA polymerase specialized sigma24 family protein
MRRQLVQRQAQRMRQQLERQEQALQQALEQQVQRLLLFCRKRTGQQQR